jgi:hypothetical protein
MWVSSSVGNRNKVNTLKRSQHSGVVTTHHAEANEART